jgi:Na+/proline symporter
VSLNQWAWVFLALYIPLMLGLGVAGRRRVKSADDFATARDSYGPLVLALAFAATTASGATFIGFPGLSYSAGISAMASAILYPAGVYLGVLLCMRMVSRGGNLFGSRSIPEFLGERYGSELIRILVSVFSLLLLFYLAGQLLSGLVMFGHMLGLDPAWALAISVGVLLIYVVMGGAHADILTDAVQGVLMLIIALLLVAIFLAGYGMDGGLLDNLAAQDARLVAVPNPDMPVYHSWWAIAIIPLAHLPLGMLPHIGNKLWALKHSSSRSGFIRLAFVFGLTLGMMGLGGLLARGVLGDLLLQPGYSTNDALPSLFSALFSPWLAALLGVGILAAIMSTADGLVISSSQVIANDLYRLSIAPRWQRHLDEAALDRRVLAISRISTVFVLLLSAAMAWLLMDHNVSLLIWMGTGGMMAAFAGPLVLGALWSGVTRTGALAGLVSGATVFGVLHAGLIDPTWFSPGAMHEAATWLQAESPNPFSCSAMGEIVSLLVTWLVSLISTPLSAAHLEKFFPA